MKKNPLPENYCELRCSDDSTKMKSDSTSSILDPRPVDSRDRHCQPSEALQPLGAAAIAGIAGPPINSFLRSPAAQ